MLPRRGSRLPCLAAFSFVAALAVPALTAACSNRCHAQSCTARIIVGPEPVTFTSAERFRPADERVVVRVFVDGRELKLVRRDGRHGCRTHLSGSGTRATVSLCGTSGPLQVRASRNWGGSVRMEIVYRARDIPQGVRGISASSSGEGGGGGVEPSGTGGVSAPTS